MGIPTVTSIVTDTTGTSIIITFSEPVTGTTGFTIYSDSVFQVRKVYTGPTGSGATRTFTLTRGVMRGDIPVISYFNGNIVSASTSQPLANFSLRVIANNTITLNTALRQKKFEIFMDPGMQNPPSPVTSFIRRIYDPGRSIDGTIDSNGVYSYTLNTAMITAAVDYATACGIPLTFDNELVPLDQRYTSYTITATGQVITPSNAIHQQNIETGREAAKALYNACKARNPNVLFGHYFFPMRKDFYSPYNVAYNEIQLFDRMPTGSNLTNYDTWYNACARMNKKWNGSTLIDDPWVWNDFLCPDVYSFFDSIQSHHYYSRENIRVCRELFSQNGTIPIYPYVWWNYHESVPLMAGFTMNANYMRNIMRNCRELADGCVIWGGYSTGRNASYIYKTTASLAQFQAVTNGSLRMIWCGVDVTFTGINLSTATSMTDVASIIAAKMNANKPTIPLKYTVQGQNELVNTGGYQLPQPEDVGLVWHAPYNAFVFYHVNTYDKTIGRRSLGLYYLSGTPATGTNLGVAPFMFNDGTPHGGIWYGEYPTLDFHNIYNEFDLYIEPTDWWAAVADINTKQNGAIPLEDEYVRSLKPVCHIRIPSDVHGIVGPTPRTIARDITGFGHDFSYYPDQFIAEATQHASYTTSDSTIVSGPAARSDSYGIKFNGNAITTNATSGSYSNGGFFHYGSLQAERYVPILGSVDEWTVSIWFKPSAAPVTTGSTRSYIIACGTNEGASSKLKGATFIYDDSGSPTGPKLYWDDSHDRIGFGVTTTNRTLALNTVFQVDQWHLVTIRFRQSDLTWDVLVNGRLDNSVTLPAQQSRRTYRWIERYFALNAAHTIVNGNGGAIGRSAHAIGDFYAWNRYQPTSEVLTLYQTVSSRYNKHSAAIDAF